MKNRSYWLGKPLNSKREANGRDLIGAGMHLLRQFEREALEVDRRGRKEKRTAVVRVVVPVKVPVFVKTSTKKVLEELKFLPLADPRHRACVKRKQRKLLSQQKYCQLPSLKCEVRRKAVRSTWKSPVKAKHDSLKKYQLRFANNRPLVTDPTYLIKTRRPGSFSYDMVPWSEPWADHAFWLSELFPKLYFRKLARYNKSRKVRRAGFARRIRKSRRAGQKLLKARACEVSKRLSDRMSMPSERCARCSMPYCSGVRGLQSCSELPLWKRSVRLGINLVGEKAEGSFFGSVLATAHAEEVSPVISSSRENLRLIPRPKRREFATFLRSRNDQLFVDSVRNEVKHSCTTDEKLD